MGIAVILKNRTRHVRAIKTLQVPGHYLEPKRGLRHHPDGKEEPCKRP